MDQLQIKQLSIEDLLEQQLSMHEKYEIQDFYKFLFQAAMGCEHAISDKSLSFQHLKAEISKLALNSSEPLIEQLAPDGKLLRVNLRPFLYMGGDPGLLNKIFFQTAADFKGSSRKLEEYWQELRNFIKRQIPEIDLELLDKFWQEILTQGFPAVHHSTAYKEKNNPAYRVILTDLIKDELKRII